MGSPFSAQLQKRFSTFRGESDDALPSSTAAMKMVQGDRAAIPAVLGTTLLRAGLLAGGMAIAGERKNLVRNAIAGSIAIEIFVLGYVSSKMAQK